MSQPASCTYHVLLVDDEPLAIGALQDLLEWEGYKVTTASDGEEALHAYDRAPVDILVTDLKMPRMDGKTLIQRLRAVRPLLPVVLMSGELPEAVVEDLRGRDPIRLMLKPISPTTLLKEMKAILQPPDEFPCAPHSVAGLRGHTPP